MGKLDIGKGVYTVLKYFKLLQILQILQNTLKTKKTKKNIESLTAVKRGGGVSGLVVVIVLRFFLHASNLFMGLKEAPKHILCSLQTSYITSLKII